MVTMVMMMVMMMMSMMMMEVMMITGPRGPNVAEQFQLPQTLLSVPSPIPSPGCNADRHHVDKNDYDPISKDADYNWLHVFTILLPVATKKPPWISSSAT